jgi:hypothetical protein
MLQGCYSIVTALLQMLQEFGICKSREDDFLSFTCQLLENFSFEFLL